VLQPSKLIEEHSDFTKTASQIYCLSNQNVAEEDGIVVLIYNELEFIGMSVLLIMSPPILPFIFCWVVN